MRHFEFRIQIWFNASLVISIIWRQCGSHSSTMTTLETNWPFFAFRAIFILETCLFHIPYIGILCASTWNQRFRGLSYIYGIKQLPLALGPISLFSFHKIHIKCNSSAYLIEMCCNYLLVQFQYWLRSCLRILILTQVCHYVSLWMCTCIYVYIFRLDLCFVVQGYFSTLSQKVSWLWIHLEVKPFKFMWVHYIHAF